ncbi:MAG: LysR family transcriptional regulator, partial [Pseudomonadota bacterium]
MAHWNEIRTAAYVARLGTVSAAAEALDVHRATVIRHIDQLEAHFGAKLFIRAKSGYTATDFGRELMRVADQADAQFAGLRRTVSAQQDG